MLIFEHFRVPTKFFHFIGHAPISSLDISSHNYTQIVAVVLSSFTALSIASFLIFVPHLSSFGLIHNVIRLSSVLSGLLVILLANWSCWRQKLVYQRLAQRVHQIEKFLIHTFSLKDTELIPNWYKTKALLIFSLFFVSQGLVFSEVLLAQNHNLLSSFFNSSLRITHPISVVHFMLYNDTIAVFLQILNQQAQTSPLVCLNAKDQLEFLKNVKRMHLDIWKLVRQVNIYFGWNLLFVIIHSFIYIQVQLYWIFLNLQVKFNILGIIGKLYGIWGTFFICLVKGINLFVSAEGSISFLYGTFSLSIFINSSRSSALQVRTYSYNLWCLHRDRFHFDSFKIDEIFGGKH